MTRNLGISIGAGTSDNNLINGKNNFDCSSVNTTNLCNSNAGISKFNFQPGKVHRIRLINAGAQAMQHFSIDSHKWQIIAADFVPMENTTHKVVPLGIGQRLDCLVYGSGQTGESYWMRSTIQEECSGGKNPNALAAVYYPDTDQTSSPTSQPWPDDLSPCEDLDASNFSPYYHETPQPAAEAHDVVINFGTNASGNWLWTMNGVSYRADYNAPTLLLTKGSQPGKPIQFPEMYNAYITNPKNDTTQVVMWHLENRVAVAHPMHLHGHNMYFWHKEMAPGMEKSHRILILQGVMCICFPHLDISLWRIMQRIQEFGRCTVILLGMLVPVCSFRWLNR